MLVVAFIVIIFQVKKARRRREQRRAEEETRRQRRRIARSQVSTPIEDLKVRDLDLERGVETPVAPEEDEDEDFVDEEEEEKDVTDRKVCSPVSSCLDLAQLISLSPMLNQNDRYLVKNQDLTLLHHSASNSNLIRQAIPRSSLDVKSTLTSSSYLHIDTLILATLSQALHALSVLLLYCICNNNL